MASIRKLPSKVWELSYYDLDGKRIRRSLGKCKKEFAQTILEKTKYELYIGKSTGANARGRKVNYREFSKRYLDWFEQEYPSSFSQKNDNFINHLDKLFGSLDLDKLTSEHIDNFIKQKRKDGLAPSTINKLLADIIAFLNYGAEKNLVVPKFKIKKIPDNDDKLPKFHSKDALQALYDNSPSHWHWWMLLANTGMRLGELMKLRVDNIKDDNIYIVSTNQDRTKSGKSRIIELNNKAKRALKEFDMSGEFLFPRYGRTVVGTALTRDCKRAGIKKGNWGVHVLRHSFASHLAMNGVDMSAIKELMGHANMKTTNKYIHLSKGHLKGAVNKIDL